MNDALRIAHGFLLGELDFRHNATRAEVVCRALIEAHAQLERHDAAAVETQRAFSAAHERIARLQKVVKRADYLIADFSEHGEFKQYTIDTYKEHRAVLKPGDMGEPTNE